MKKRLIGAMLSISMLAGIFGSFTIHAATDINATVDTWGVQKQVDDTKIDGWQTSKGKDGYCCLAVNTDYDFVYVKTPGENADHFTYLNSKEVAYTRDWAVEFDMFLNNIDCSDCVTDASDTKRTIRLGVGYDDTDGNLVKNYYDNFYSDLRTKTLNDDDGKAHYIYEATARKKYGLDTSTGADYINVRLAIKDNVFYICRKWNNAEKWVVSSKRLTTADCRNYMYIQSGAQIGIDNLTVYRPKENIVKEPEAYTYYDLVDEDAGNMIVNPHFGTPVFTEPGAIFAAEFTNNKEDVDFTKGTFDVYLENEYKSWYAYSTTPAAGDIYLGTKKGYTVDVTVPEDITPELLNLYMVHKNEAGIVDAEYFAPKSVQVTEELDQDFYSVAISDTHIDKWGSPEYSGKNARVLQFFNKALSIGGVRYLSHSGDINDNPSKDRATSMKETFVRAFEDSDVPLIVVAGNHEYDTYTYPSATETKASDRTQMTYEEYANDTSGTYTDSNVQLYNTFDEETFDEFFGTKTALINMGEDMAIAKHDFGAWTKLTGEESVFIKLRDALASAWDNSTADYRIIYQHSENTGKENLAEETYGMAAFMAPNYHKDYLATNPQKYDMQYTGHYHKTYVRTEDVITLGGLGKASASWQGHGVISNFTYNADAEKKWTNSAEEIIQKYGNFDENGIGTYDEALVDEIQTDFIDNFNMMTEAIEENYYKTNDGSADYNIATVKNNIDFNFYDGRIKFIMQPGTYTVSGGEILSQYDSYNGSKTIVVAKVNIPKGSKEAPSYINVVCKPSETGSSEAAILTIKGAETGYVSPDVTYLDIVSNTDIDADTFTTESISLTNNGFAQEFTLTYPDIKTARMNFAEPLEPNSKYTVTLSDNVKVNGDMTDTAKNFQFVVLPKEGIEFIKNTVVAKSSSGYTPSTNMTATIDGTTKKTSQLQYENYVLDYTLAIPAYQTETDSTMPTPAEEATVRLDWLIYTDDAEGNTVTLRPRSVAPTIDTAPNRTYVDALGNVDALGKYINFSDSVLKNPLELKSENAYDFRVVKLGDTWTLYAKNVSSDCYDIVFTLSAAAQKLYSGKGYTDPYVSVPGSQSYWYNYILYPIENTTTVPEVVGSEFDVTFNVQPDELDKITVEGLGEVSFEKLSPKTYKVTMPDAWNKNSQESNISLVAVNDVYNNALSEMSIKPAEYELVFDEIKILQNGEYTDTVSAGEFKVESTVRQNWTLPEDASLICAIYDSHNKRLIEAVVIEPENISYNGTDVEFTMKSNIDNPIIKIFAFDMTELNPLALKSEK